MAEKRTLAQRMKNIRTQWKVGAVLSFLLSLIMGIMDGGPYPMIYTLLWLLFGFFFLFCIFKAFPRSWHLLVPLSFIYLFAFVGTVAFIRTENIFDLSWIGLGLFSQALALWFLFIILFTVTNRRDEISAVRDYQRKKGEGVAEIPISLGFWSLSLFLLLFACNLSIWYLGDHQMNDTIKGLVGYLLCETAVLFLWFYIISVPESHIDLTPDDEVKPSTHFQRLGDFIHRFSLTKKAPSIGDLVQFKEGKKSPFKKNIPCPKCGIFLVGEKRICPKCSRARRFAWCPSSEDFIINCPLCSALVKVSSGKCDRCGQDLTDRVKCACGNESPLKTWSLVKADSDR